MRRRDLTHREANSGDRRSGRNRWNGCADRYARAVQASPSTTTVSQPGLVLVSVVVLGSAIGATAIIGPGYVYTGLPAAVMYLFPILLNIAVVKEIRERTRSSNVWVRRVARREHLGYALLLAVSATLATHLRLGHLDVTAMVLAGTVSGAGPLVLTLVLLRKGQPAPAERRGD